MFPFLLFLVGGGGTILGISRFTLGTSSWLLGVNHPIEKVNEHNSAQEEYFA